MAITFTENMEYTRAGEGTPSDVISGHNAIIWLFQDGAINPGPGTATIQFVVKNNAGATIYTSSLFSAYLLSFSAPTAKFRFDATEIIKHIINNYFYREMSNDVISPENYGSELEVEIKTFDNAVLEDTENIDYFASHALNQIGDEAGANIPRMFYNDTEDIAHFLGYPNKLFFFARTTLAAETPIIEILPAIANLITAWINGTYDTFTSTTVTITSAINIGPSSAVALSNEFSIKAGQYVRIVFDLTLNSGTAPNLNLWDDSGGGSAVSDTEVSASGANAIVLFAFVTTSVCTIRISNSPTDASNFSTDAVHAQLLIAYSEAGTLGLFVHALDLYAFQLTSLVKQVLVKYDPTDPTLVKTFNLDVFEPCENAVYIRYLNSEGYYAFWAFSPFPFESIQSNQIGSVINAFSDMAAANSRNKNIGYRDAFKRLDVIASAVPLKFQRKLLELFTSPAVYIWQGKETPDDNLISSFANIGYETLTTDGTVIISAINSAANGEANAGITKGIVQGKKIVVMFDLVLNSGDLPVLTLTDDPPTAIISNEVTTAAGYNQITLTAISTDLSSIFLRLRNATNANWSTGKIVVKRAELETDWLLLERVEGSHTLREKKKADNFECTLVLPEKYTQQLGGSV